MARHIQINYIYIDFVLSFRSLKQYNPYTDDTTWMDEMCSQLVIYPVSIPYDKPG